MRRLTVGDYVFEYDPSGAGDTTIIFRNHPEAAANHQLGGNYQWEVRIPTVVMDAFKRQRVYEAMEEFLGPGGTEGIDVSKMEAIKLERYGMKVEDQSDLRQSAAYALPLVCGSACAQSPTTSKDADFRSATNTARHPSVLWVVLCGNVEHNGPAQQPEDMAIERVTRASCCVQKLPRH